MLKSYELSRPLSLVVAPPRGLGEALQARVNGLWATALAAQPTLFDGPILTVVDRNEARLVVSPASYRLVLAARRDPQVAAALKLRPLAVSGILACAEGLVFGRRGPGITDGEGLWELVPSGGIEPSSDGSPPDLGRQILLELREEVGLDPDQAVVHEPLGMIEDTQSGTIDLVVPLTTRLSAAEIVTAHRRRATQEYGELRAIGAPYDLGEDSLLPESRLVLKVFVPKATALAL